MQLFSDFAISGRRLNTLYIFRSKSLLFVMAFAVVCASTLVVHAATLHTSVYEPFGILKSSSGASSTQTSGDNTVIPRFNVAATSSTSIDVEHSVDSINTQQPLTSVTIDTTKVYVPDNGTVSKTVTSDDGQSTVNVQVSNQSTNTSSHNSLRINSSSHSSQSSSTTSIQKVTSQGDLQT
jgi:hypothetical protein